MKIPTGAASGIIEKKPKITIRRTARILPVTLILCALLIVASPAILNASPANSFIPIPNSMIIAANKHTDASYNIASTAASSAGFLNITAPGPTAPTPISRIRVRDFLLLAAERYNDGLNPEDILKGSPGEGDAHYLRAVTRLEAIVMISRAFGRLPAPAGDLSRSGTPVPYFSDIPLWAEPDVRNLANALILLPTPDKTLNGDAIIDESEFFLMLNRIYALLSSAPEDDFYHAINKSWLDKSILRAGESTDSVFDELGYDTGLKIDELFDSILTGVWSKGAKEQKISDLYRCIINMNSRDSAGVDPIMPYLVKIAYVKDLNALDDILYSITESLGIDLFFGFTAETDLYNSAKYSIYFTYPAPSLPKIFAADTSCPQTDAFLQYATRLFELAGYNNPGNEAKAVVDIDARLASAQRDPAAPVNYADDYKKISIKRLETLFPDTDLKKLSSVLGFKPENEYYVRDIGLLYAFAGLYSTENLEALKAYATYKLLDACSDMLSGDFADARFTLANAMMGQPEKKDPEQSAKEKVKALMSSYLGEMYAEKYFSLAAKRDVEAIARIMIEVYKARIDTLDWMGDATKAAAKAKLDKLDIIVGIPRKWDCVMDSVNIIGPSEGGSYFENMTAYYRQSHALNAKKQGKSVNNDTWDIGVFTVNAYYKPSANAIILPMGILQAPFYIYGGRKEVNFGGIGCIIAHEITHAIDFYGAQFNGNGNLDNWWTDADRARFFSLCESVAAHYDGYEAAAGIMNNGELTLFENIADLGMLACALGAVETLPDPDYRLFFQSAAKIWASTSERKALEYYTLTDTHSPSNVRVNKTFQNFQQFYDAFGIKRGNGMYIDPEKRLKVW